MVRDEGQKEHGGHDGNVLEEEDDLAHDLAQDPRLCHVPHDRRGHAHKDSEEVAKGQVGQEEVGGLVGGRVLPPQEASEDDAVS